MDIDGFWRLIGPGREAFELVEADPDALAELPSIQRLAGRTFHEWDEEHWPWWESLAYVAAGAYPPTRTTRSRWRRPWPSGAASADAPTRASRTGTRWGSTRG